MSISAARRVGVVTAEIPGAKEILEDLGIDCCMGDRSLADACLIAGVPVREVVGRLQGVETSKKIAPEFVDWRSASLSQLVSHIVDRRNFTRKELERLEQLLGKVCSVHGQHHPELLSIQKLFSELKEEFLTHMLKEEVVLFPYMCAMDEAAADGGPAKAFLR